MTGIVTKLGIGLIAIGLLIMLGTVVGQYPLNIMAETPVGSISVEGLPAWAETALFTGGFFVLVGAALVILGSR